MDKCEFLDTCYFYKNSSDSPLKESYCDSNCLHCARFMVFQALGSDKAPDQLMPDEKMQAYALLAEN